MNMDSGGPMKKCPYCAELILADAIKCKHCQSDLSGGGGPPKATETTSKGGALGTIMLFVPLVATPLIWFWIGNMALIQRPDSSLAFLGFVTVILTAILGAAEASGVGAGKDNDLDKKGRKRSGPVAWFFAISLLWLFSFPAWLYRRSAYGLKNLLPGGIVFALIFTVSWGMMNAAIEAKRAEVLNALSGVSSVAPGDLQSPESNLSDMEARLASLQEEVAEPVVTRAEFDEIEEGMSYERVEVIIGASGEEVSSSEIAGYKTVMYQWSNPGGGNMNAMFQNGKLVNKAQFGLR